jgi:hypothetical protein
LANGRFERSGLLGAYVILAPPLGATRDAAWRISAIAKLARKLGRSGTELKADMAPAQEESQGFYRKPPLFPSSKGIKLA